MLAQQYTPAPISTTAALLIPNSENTPTNLALASIIGTDEAIFLQQLHYRMNGYGKSRDGKIWYWNSLKQWSDELFWTRKRVRYVTDNLREMNLIIVTDEYNERKKGHFWYTINQEKLDAIIETLPKRAERRAKNGTPSAINDTPLRVNCAKNGTPLPRENQENPQEIYHQESRAHVGGGGNIQEVFLPLDDEATNQDASLIVEKLGAMPQEAQKLATQATAARNEYGPAYIAELLADITNAPEIKDPIAVLTWRIKNGARIRTKKGDAPLDREKYTTGKYSRLFNRDQDAPQDNTPQDELSPDDHPATAPLDGRRDQRPIKTIDQDEPTDDRQPTEKSLGRSNQEARPTPQNEPTPAMAPLDTPTPRQEAPRAWRFAREDLAKQRPIIAAMLAALKFYAIERDNEREIWQIVTSNPTITHYKRDLERTINNYGRVVELDFYTEGSY